MGQCVEVDYKSIYTEMHRDPRLYEGSCMHLHAQTISTMINQTQSKTLLDYGCGKAIQYKVEGYHNQYFNGIMPALYDIGVPEYNTLPEGMFDGVVSTDVLEHIPEDQIDECLEEIFTKARKFVYLGICTIPATSFLPTGENSHITLKPLQWWVDKSVKFVNNLYTVVHTYGVTKGTAMYRDGKLILFKDR